ncbi:MAG TPA: helix-turn-helix domain-containing protein, partial [Burkholderiales bacterium]
ARALVDSDYSFGAWLRQRRKALGLTHAALAERAYCSVSALRKIEQDERRPSQRLAERLAGCLQIGSAERARFVALARGEGPVQELARGFAVPLPSLPPARASELEGPAPLRSALPPLEEMPSIAVLPFINLSDDAANEYFADGLAAELLNVLARIPGLRVASRTSAFWFKGKDVDLPTAAHKLNVSTILEGSVRKSGQRVRIAAQLVRVATDSPLWSQTYDRDLQDVLSVQDDIAQSVVQELRQALLGEQVDAVASARVQAQMALATRGRTGNPQAHKLYLQGRFLIDRLTRDDTSTGIGYCRRALEMDPNYALAWCGLACAYSSQAGFYWVPPAEAFELARSAAQHALRIEPDLPEAHSELGWVRMTCDWDWAGAEQSYRRALATGSGNRSIVIAASLLADNVGRKDDAVALARRAVALDPLSFTAQGNLALRALNADLLDEAMTAVQTAIGLNPRGVLLHWLHGTILLAQGRPEEAFEAFGREEVPQLRAQGFVLAHHAAGRQKESDAALAQLIETGAEDSAFQIAEALGWRGDVDDAFEWLERAYEQRDPGVGQLRSGPFFRKLEADPRWAAFLRKIGFTGLPDGG